MVFVCVKEQQLQKVQDLVPTLLLSHPAVAGSWSDPVPYKRFHLWLGSFIPLCL